MVKIENLGFSYGAEKVLDGIYMELLPGKIYGLLGENGVGKTTLLTLLCGLKSPQGGSLLIDGENPARRSPSLYSRIVYLPDEVAPIHDSALRWAKAIGSFRPKYDHELFMRILNEFEVSEKHMMDKMSNGQLKKTYISFALACAPDYLFMDEPTNGLDIPGKAQFRQALMKYTGEESTIVISTHQVRDLENIIDPIIILDRKSVLVNASLEEISSKLTFDYGSSLHPENIYCEQLPGGFIQVYPNVNGSDSKVNIEALFNAAHRNKDYIKAMFSHE